MQIEQVFSDFLDVNQYENYVVSQMMDHRTDESFEEDYESFLSFEVEQ